MTGTAERLTAPPPGDRTPPMSTSSSLRTSAWRASAPAKPSTMPGLSVKPAGRRSGVPTPTRLTFTPAIQAVVHCLCAALSPSGLRLLSEHARGHGHPRAHQTYRGKEARSGSDWTCSGLAGMGTPELIKRIAERKPGAEATGPAERLTAVPPGSGMPPMSIISSSLRTSASRASAPRKAEHDARLCLHCTGC